MKFIKSKDEFLLNFKYEGEIKSAKTKEKKKT